jgi:hypothetical protein
MGRLGHASLPWWVWIEDAREESGFRSTGRPTTRHVDRSMANQRADGVRMKAQYIGQHPLMSHLASHACADDHVSLSFFPPTSLVPMSFVFDRCGTEGSRSNHFVLFLRGPSFSTCLALSSIRCAPFSSCFEYSAAVNFKDSPSLYKRRGKNVRGAHAREFRENLSVPWTCSPLFWLKGSSRKMMLQFFVGKKVSPVCRQMGPRAT